MVTIGNERGFNALLAKGVHQALKQRIDERAPKSVLDIGAHSGEALCLLYHRFPSFTHLEGWETDSEERVLAALRKADAVRSPNARYRTLYERYCMHATNYLPSGRRPLNTELEYKKVIRLRHGVDVTHTRPLLPDYDLLVLNNALHRLPADELLPLRNTLEKVHRPDTLVYLHHKERPADGYTPSNSDALVREHFEHLATAWHLSQIPGIVDHEGRHTTYTNLIVG